MIDTHSHLYDKAFDEDRENVIRKAVEAGVTKIILPAIDPESHQKLFELATEYPDICFPAIGLHPTSVNGNPDYLEDLDEIERYLDTPPKGISKFYAVGETGLDLYWSKDYIRQQTEAFEKQVCMAIGHGLPLIIHTRNAWEEMIEILQKYKGEGLKGVMHAYSGNADQYETIKQTGDFVFGIGGTVTYKNSELPMVMEKMDMKDIVIETDCPYLTPVPFRGKRNESGFLVYIRNKIAEIYGVTIHEADQITTQNAQRIFNI